MTAIEPETLTPSGDLVDNSHAFRLAIASGVRPRPAKFETPDNRFLCCACMEFRPDAECAGWIAAVVDDGPFHGCCCMACVGGEQ